MRIGCKECQQHSMNGVHRCFWSLQISLPCHVFLMTIKEKKMIDIMTNAYKTDVS